MSIKLCILPASLPIYPSISLSTYLLLYLLVPIYLASYLSI